MSQPVSDFYLACRNGDLTTVQHLLATLTMDEINQIEPNGSTSLHAASSYNHPEVVKLLLDHGAMRTVVNRKNLTPAEEAATEEIKELFPRPNPAVKERFQIHGFGKELEWVWSNTHTVNGTVEGWTATLADKNRYYMRNTDVRKAAARILEDCRYRNVNGMDKIKWFLQRAQETDNPVWFVKAYTSNTGFYKALNEALAKGRTLFDQYDRDNFRESIYAFAGCFLCHPIGHDKLSRYRYGGISYRGMTLHRTDFERNYTVGNEFMIKSLTSTSKTRQVANIFKDNTSQDSTKLSVICIFNTTGEPRRPNPSCKSRVLPIALDISAISEFPEEDEVLIVAHTAFRIQSIEQLSSGVFEVKLLWIWD